MSLKHDQRRPVPMWLARVNSAELGASDFPLADVLQHSLYYPAAGFDGRPVQFLGGFIHSFIYVDYGNEEQAVDVEVQAPGFLGYHLVGSKRLRERDLAPSGWRPQVPPQFRNQTPAFADRQAHGFVRKPFATWYIFDRDDDMGEDHGPQRFSLVYLCADGVAAYQALYWPNHTAPDVLAIIQPGTGFGGNYTDFRDPDGFFAWTVLRGNGPAIPEYIVCGGALLDYTQAFWPDHYPKHVEWFQRENGNGVWRRKVVDLHQDGSARPSRRRPRPRFVVHEEIALLLAEFVTAEAQRLDETYNWDIPANWPICTFERGDDSLANANIRLKRALSTAWHDRPEDRASIERWYVSNWGGVRANRKETLAAYAASTDEELLRRGLNGVASWSKILVIRNPERYVIYDARVGAALNALQIARDSRPPLLFPKVSSRNTVIQNYQASEDMMAPEAFRVPRGQAYLTYLDLIIGVAEQLNFEMLDMIEMVLFANAERLAGEALARG